MKSKLVLILSALALTLGAAACTDTLGSTDASTAPAAGAATEGSTYGTDSRSLSVGGAGMGSAGNGGGSGTGVVGSH